MENETAVGKYDNVSAATCAMLRADAVVLCVVNGVVGNGFSVSASIDPALVKEMIPTLLRKMADDIEGLPPQATEGQITATE